MPSFTFLLTALFLCQFSGKVLLTDKLEYCLEIIYQGGDEGKAWERKGMLSTGLIAMFNGPANDIGVGRFIGEVIVTGCPKFIGDVTGVDKFTPEARDNEEVMDNGVVIATGCPKFICEAKLDTFTGLLILIAAATVTGFVIVPEAAIEEVILNGEVRVTGVVIAVEVWHMLPVSSYLIRL